MFNISIAKSLLPVVDWNFGDFNKIYDTSSLSSYPYDYSLFAVIKLLIAPRIADKKYFCYWRKLDRYSTLSGDGYEDLEKWGYACALLHNDYDYPTMTTAIVEEDVFDSISKLKRDTPLPAVEQLFTQRKLPIIILKKTADNGSSHTVALIKRTRSLGKSWHTLASLVPALIPEFFTKSPIDDDEKAMLLALDGTEPSKFLESVNSLISKKKYFSEYIREKLTGFTGVKYEAKIRQREENIRFNRDRIKDYLITIDDLRQKIETDELMIIGLKEKFDETKDTEELLDYITNNKAINVVSVEGSLLIVTINTYLQNYDPDIYERVSKNPKSSLYYGLQDVGVTFEDCKKLYDLIFSKEELKIRITQSVSLGTNNQGNTVLNRYRTTPDSERLPNPHIHHHSCFGNNEDSIRELIAEADYIGALAQLIGSVSNINFADGIVTQEFTYDLFASGAPRCIEFPDGTCLTAKEALERINNEQTNSTNE